MMKIMLTPPIAAISAALLALVSFTAVANPTVKIMAVNQHFPWDGKIDVIYTVGGVEDPAAFALGLSCVQGAETNALETFVTTAPTAENGTWTVTWDSQADGVAFPSGKADFLADLHAKEATDGDYMIVDLAGGSDATGYAVTYLSDIADPTNHFNTTEYKTTKIVLKRIKAGSFWMGSPDGGAAFGKTNEKYHYVMFTNDYFIGMFMLTAGQYVRVTGEDLPAGLNEDMALTGKIGGIDGLLKADGFLARLNARATSVTTHVSSFGEPTEARWEYACRAGTTTTWFFGEDASLLKDYAYFNNDSAPRVGNKLPNPWCLWDMYGYLQEYTYDTWNADYPESTEANPAIEPVSFDPKSRGNRPVRGGAGWNDATACRSACRVSTTSNTASASNGFRLQADVMDQSPFRSVNLCADVPIDTSSTKTDIADVTLTLVTNRVEQTGSAVAAPIVLSYEGRALVLGEDYTLAYSDNVNPGICIVTVTGCGDFAASRLTSFRIVSPCVAESQRTAAKIDLRDGVLTVTVPGTLFNLAYNNVADWPQGGEASETVKAVISAAPLETAESEPAEGDFVTVLASGGEGTVKWRPTTRYTMVRLQIERDGVVDPESTMTRVIDATINGLMLILR